MSDVPLGMVLNSLILQSGYHASMLSVREWRFADRTNGPRPTCVCPNRTMGKQRPRNVKCAQADRAKHPRRELPTPRPVQPQRLAAFCTAACSAPQWPREAGTCI